METREIPRDEWTAFFDWFSQRREKCCVNLEVFGAEIGDQIEAREVSLAGITAELDHAGDQIQIMIGSTPTDHFSHIIRAPAQVSLEIDDHGNETLAIEAADGTMNLLRFRSAPLPWIADAVEV